MGLTKAKAQDDRVVSFKLGNTRPKSNDEVVHAFKNSEFSDIKATSNAAGEPKKQGFFKMLFS
jgi:hypothetical protein